MKTLNKQFEKQQVQGALVTEIENFWQTTRDEVEFAIEELDFAYRKKLDELESNLDLDNFEELPKKKAIVEMNMEMYDKLMNKI